VGAIALQDKQAVRVGNFQYRGSGEGLLEVAERGLAFRCPVKAGIFLCQVVEGSCNAEELFNELPIKVGKCNELLELSDVPGRGPVRYCFDLGTLQTFVILPKEKTTDDNKRLGGQGTQLLCLLTVLDG
jgi:hypothetical protein